MPPLPPKLFTLPAQPTPRCGPWQPQGQSAAAAVPAASSGSSPDQSQLRPCRCLRGDSTHGNRKDSGNPPTVHRRGSSIIHPTSGFASPLPPQLCLAPAPALPYHPHPHPLPKKLNANASSVYFESPAQPSIHSFPLPHPAALPLPPPPFLPWCGVAKVAKVPTVRPRVRELIGSGSGGSLQLHPLHQHYLHVLLRRRCTAHPPCPRCHCLRSHRLPRAAASRCSLMGPPTNATAAVARRRRSAADPCGPD